MTNTVDRSAMFETRVNAASLMYGRMSALFPDKPFDEVSLLFGIQEEYIRFCDEANDRGLHFAGVKEHQRQVGGEEEFFTQFEFVWPYPDAEWRIEAMLVLGGTAPLHRRFMRKAYSDVGVVHVSWKEPDAESYFGSRIEMEYSMGLELAREYRNGYGRFAYYPIHAPEHGNLLTYIKPRINERDT